MTIVVMIIATFCTTLTNGTQEITKGITGHTMYAKNDGDHPTIICEGHATHGPTYHGHKSSTSNNGCR